MQSSLTMVIPITLAYSARPPVSVSGTGALVLPSGFSRQHGLNVFASLEAPHQVSALTGRWIYLPSLPTPLDRLFHPSATPSLLRHHVGNNVGERGRNVYLLSIDYAFQPRLRSRLTLGGSTFPRKPWSFGEQDSHLFVVTHACILTSHQSTTLYNVASPRWQRSPTDVCTSRSFGVMLSPLHFRRRDPRPVSYYALFKGWLLLSQPPGCLGISTSLPHLA